MSNANQFCVAVLTIAVLMLAGLFFAVTRNSDSDPARKTTYEYTPIPPPAPVPKITYDPPVVSKPIPDAITLFKDAAGNTYSVPNIEYNRLLMMKSALTPKQIRIDTLQAQQETLGATIARSRKSLDNTNQYQVDDFNRMVNRYNALNEEIEPLINDFNREVDRFNSELERVGTLIR